MATLAGIDADANVLTPSASGEGFDLAAAGMRLVPAASPAGRANATFELATHLFAMA
ncbi:MAG: hypothetical protein WKG07_04570 [Hymenobacter sp.]